MAAAADSTLELSTRADAYDDILDDRTQRDGARPRSATPMTRIQYNPMTVWLVALSASIVWIAAVAAFCWSYFSLPPDIGEVAGAAGLRIEPADWMMIAAAILGPLLLIWLVAWLVNRTNEMRAQTQELASTALRLAAAAREVRASERAALPAPLLDGEVAEGAPRHLRREVERATHAISALHGQMRAIEEALSAQAAAIDDVAERAENRARLISQMLSSERVALAGVVDRIEARGGLGPADETALEARAAQADAVDLSLSGRGDNADGDAVEEGAEALGEEQRAQEAERSEWLTNPDPLPDDADVEVGRYYEDHPASAPLLGADAELQPDQMRIDPFDDIGRAVAAGATPLRASLDDDDGDPRDDLLTRRARRHEIDWHKLVKAANFPESEDDTQTLDALYDVLPDPEIASFLQTAEDTLASLADLDLYMEDFGGDLVPAEAWSAMLREGESLPGQGSDDGAVEMHRIRAKISSDPGFARLTEKLDERYRAVAARMLEESGDPSMLVDLSDTRTGRAFLLVLKALTGISPPIRTTNTG